jgi:cytochrome c
MKVLMLAAAAIVALSTSVVLADGDVEAGKTVFKKCAACHAVGEGAKNRVGPVLNDLFGRVAGTFADYKYSQAMIDAGVAGKVWDAETLPPYLHKPKDVVPGTKMSFGGLSDDADVANLLAYLMTLSPNYVPAVPAEGTDSSAVSSAPAQ